jgi:hypothetical protein
VTNAIDQVTGFVRAASPARARASVTASI